MEIHILRPQEILPALQLIWEVFADEIAPSYTPEGVAEFQKYIDYDFIMQAYERKEIIFFGAFEKGEIKGTLAVRPDGHICLFFVKKEYQGIGLGRALFQTMYNFCVQQLRVSKITVNAAPQAVTKYIHMGMRQVGNMEERNGIRSVPMEMYANPGLVRPVKLRSNKTGIIVAIVILAVVLFVGLIGFMGFRLIEGMYEDDMQRGYGVEESDEEYQEEVSGAEGIPEYIDTDISYEIKEELYDFTDEEKTSTVIDFYVNYPQLEGLDHKVADKVNQTIKDYAMKTVNEIYLNPTEEIKETVLHSELPVLVSYVTYKVSYANEDFISILMEDQSYKGNEQEYCFEFRTLNISLKDGMVYEVKDIVDIDDEFVDEWLKVMRSEAGSQDFLSEMSKKEMKESLKGDSLGGVYEVNFFVDADGIEIGYSLNYEDGDENDLGYAWVTAPFSFEEIEKYTVKSSFWNEIN